MRNLDETFKKRVKREKFAKNFVFPCSDNGMKFVFLSKIRAKIEFRKQLSKKNRHKFYLKNPKSSFCRFFSEISKFATKLVVGILLTSFVFEIDFANSNEGLPLPPQNLSSIVEWHQKETFASSCPEIDSAEGTQNDISGALQTCIDSANDGDTILLKPGVYTIENQIFIKNKSVAIATLGKKPNDPRCKPKDESCVELRAAPNIIFPSKSLLNMEVDGATIRHIIVNGNRSERIDSEIADDCRATNNSRGGNIAVTCSNCSVIASVSKNALCATALLVGWKIDNVNISRNTITDNGVHRTVGLWADGITVWDPRDSVFENNILKDNTDVDLIFGGCQNCKIQNNQITHTEDPNKGAFAAIMIHAWPTTSGNFTGTVVSGNSVDCGSGKECGMGLTVGADGWYVTETFGGEIYNNTIKNAQQGINIDSKAHDMAIYNNSVSGTAERTLATCGYRQTTDYNMHPSAKNIDTKDDTVEYSENSWIRCVPNQWIIE